MKLTSALFDVRWRYSGRAGAWAWQPIWIYLPRRVRDEPTVNAVGQIFGQVDEELRRNAHPS